MVVRDGECRVRTDHAPADFCTIKHLAQNLIRRAPGKTSMQQKRIAPPGMMAFSPASSLNRHVHPIPLDTI